MANDPRSQAQDPSPPAQQAAPRTEQLIQTHKAWITAAAGMQSRHTRRRPRYLRPLAISTGIAAAVMLLLSLGGGVQAPTITAADLSADLIPTLGRADAAPRAGAKPVAHGFRGRKSKDEGRRDRGKAGGRREQAAPRAATEPAESLPEQRVPDAAPAPTAAPAATPQLTDGRAAARPDSAVTVAADAQGPRTAAAAPDAQD